MKIVCVDCFEETNIEAILAVMNTGELVVKISLKKVLGRTGFECKVLQCSQQRSINLGSRDTVFWSFPSFADLCLTFDVFDLRSRSKLW